MLITSTEKNGTKLNAKKMYFLYFYFSSYFHGVCYIPSDMVGNVYPIGV